MSRPTLFEARKGDKPELRDAPCPADDVALIQELEAASVAALDLVEVLYLGNLVECRGQVVGGAGGEQRRAIGAQAGAGQRPGAEGVHAAGGVAAQLVPVAERALQREMKAVIALPEVREKMVAQGQTPVGNTPEEFSAMIVTDCGQGMVRVRSIPSPLICSAGALPEKLRKCAVRSVNRPSRRLRS